jgi:hypothetical protein
MFVRGNSMQVNLEPENDHEREAIDLLSAHNGQATIHSGVNIGTCQGGYMRVFGESNCLAITINKEKVAP